MYLRTMSSEPQNVIKTICTSEMEKDDISVSFNTDTVRADSAEDITVLDSKKHMDSTTKEQFTEHSNGRKDTGMGTKKKRGRKRRPKGGPRHHWKPYDQLNWVQRQKLEDRETKRATKKREAAFESGHAVAPYNTTQFLIEDHLNNGQSMSPDLEITSGTGTNENINQDLDSDSESIEEIHDSPRSENFLKKDFSEAYTNIHAERLQNMNKSDLIKEYLLLESKNEFLEERLRQLTKHHADSSLAIRSNNNLFGT